MQLRSHQQIQDPEQSLNGGQAAEQQLAGAETSADCLVAKVLVAAPDAKDDREEDGRERQPRMKEEDHTGHRLSVVEARMESAQPGLGHNAAQ